MIAAASELQQALDDVAARALPMSLLLDAAAKDAPVPAQVVSALVDLGLTGSAVGEASGGLGLSLPELADLCEVVGRRLVPAAIRDQALLLAPLLERCNLTMLDAVLNGDVRGGGAIVLEERTASLVRDGDGLSLALDGVPAWLLPEARLVAVAGDAWVALFDLTTAHVDQRPARALDAAQGFCLLHCDAQALNGASILTGDEAATLLHRHRVGLLAECIGVADAALHRAVDHATERRQFGRPIAAFQAVAHMLSDAKALVETSRSGLARLLALTPADGTPDDAAHILALALSHTVPAAARTVCETAIQVHGGIGFTWEYGLHLHYRRALHLQVRLGGASGSAARVGARYLEERRHG
jgi:alkylation response protein AidB-like acyl-CoA dehydrogenase